MAQPTNLKLTLGVILLAISLYAWMWFVRQNFFPLYTSQSNPKIYFGVPTDKNPWLEPWQRWDTLHYQAIASRGYAAFDTALFTPPLYPWLMKSSAWFFGGNTLAAGLFISGVFAVLTAITFHQTALDILRDVQPATRATLYFLSYPGAFFLFAAYTEAIYLFFTLLTLRLASQNKFFLAGVTGGLTALTRSPGILVILPLLFAAWHTWKEKKSKRGFIAILVTLTISLVYPVTAWVAVSATPLEIAQAIGRGGHLTFPGLNLLAALRQISTGQLVGENTLEVAFTLIFIVLTILAYKNLPRLYGIYAITIMLFLLCRMGNPQPLVGMIRYVYTIFPAFIVLAKIGQTSISHRLILYPSWVGLFFLAGQFSIWGWVG